MTQPVGFFEIPAGSTADVVVTGLGGMPKALQFLASDHGGISRSIGTDNGPPGGAVATRTQIFAGASSHERSDHSIYTDGVNAQVKSMDPDGFTIEVFNNACVTVTVVHFQAYY